MNPFFCRVWHVLAHVVIRIKKKREKLPKNFVLFKFVHEFKIFIKRMVDQIPTLIVLNHDT